ncbi:hypothetical protein ASZ90_017797 [hydrocarbon metagenome]|uniref:DUF3189 family protein n=1 Tax=hydrocarbon metagenome TaxID=938273 RepID=A0A0W8E7S2_9ZZZZ
MKVIYHCYGGAHSSVIAAALHLKMIEKQRLPTEEEMMAVPYYDKTDNGDFGSIRFMGIDDSGNEVYVLGKKSMGEKYSRILVGVAEIMGAGDEIIAIDCLNRVNISMKLGGFLSRRIGLIFPGRPVLFRGTRKAFMTLVNLVETVRLKSMDRCR